MTAPHSEAALSTAPTTPSGDGGEASTDRIARLKRQMRQHGGVDADDMEWMADHVAASLATTPTPVQPKDAKPAGNEALREVLKIAQKALEPFANRVLNDNGDIAVTDTHRCGLDEFTGAYFAHRSALAALAASSHPNTGQETGAARSAERFLSDPEVKAQIRQNADEMRVLKDRATPSSAAQPNTGDTGEHIQHVKSGGWYEVLARDAQVQTSEPLTDYAFVAVYRNAITGMTWVRPETEMNDGRFRPAPAHYASTPATTAETHGPADQTKGGL